MAYVDKRHAWTDQFTGEVRHDRPDWDEYRKQIAARKAATSIRDRLRPYVGSLPRNDLHRFTTEVAESSELSRQEARSVVLRELTLLRDEVDKQDTAVSEAQEERRRLRELVGPVRERTNTEGMLPSEELDLLARALAATQRGMTVEQAEVKLLEAFDDLLDGLKLELAQGDDTDRERLERLNETTAKGHDVSDDPDRYQRAAETLKAELDRMAQEKVDAGEADSLAKARVQVRHELPKLREFERTLADRAGSVQVEKAQALAERAERALRAKAESLHGSPELWDVPIGKLLSQVRHRHPKVTALTRNRGEIHKADLDDEVVEFLDEWAPR